MGNLFSQSVEQVSPEETREKASELARKRDEAFQKSRECYARGDHQGAKTYSQQGKAYAAQMEQLNRQAADSAFAKNNQGHSLDTIDLHGLFVEEALSRLRQRIQLCQSKNITTLNVITGKGLHSQDGIPRVKIAVLEYLKEENMNFNVNEHNQGIVQVEVKKEKFIIKLFKTSVRLLKRILC